MTLIWREAEKIKNNPRTENIPCYEASIAGGKYRVAPVDYVGGAVGYEAFFIPDEGNSWADVRDIAEHLTSIDQAKAIAENDARGLTITPDGKIVPKTKGGAS